MGGHRAPIFFLTELSMDHNLIEFRWKERMGSEVEVTKAQRTASLEKTAAPRGIWYNVSVDRFPSTR
jgi:hypothetical protein